MLAFQARFCSAAVVSVDHSLSERIAEPVTVQCEVAGRVELLPEVVRWVSGFAPIWFHHTFESLDVFHPSSTPDAAPIYNPLKLTEEKH